MNRDRDPEDDLLSSGQKLAVWAILAAILLAAVGVGAGVVLLVVRLMGGGAP